jgi:N-acetylglucosamine kinase-like BadF-type ATPase
MRSRETRAEDLVIGIDGGQSSTRTLLAELDGRILGSFRTGPANHIGEPGGLERQYRALHDGYLGAFAGAGLEPRELACAYLGLTGSGHLETAHRAIPARRLVLKGDVITAFAGALPELVGVVVIAGTGSIAYGRNSQGREHRTGGWGYFAGDEGSGYDIARHAFRAVFQAADGRSPATMLTDMLLAHYGCANLLELRRAVYSGDLTRDRLAGASEVVGRAAAFGDDAALRLLDEAAQSLALLVTAVLSELDLGGDDVPVAPVGGVFGAGELLLAPLFGYLRERHPGAFIRRPRLSPDRGAVVLALNELGVEIGEQVLTNLESATAAG